MYCIIGGVHAVQSERTVHHGGPSVQLHVPAGRSGHDRPGPDQ